MRTRCHANSLFVAVGTAHFSSPSSSHPLPSESSTGNFPVSLHPHRAALLLAPSFSVQSLKLTLQTPPEPLRTSNTAFGSPPDLRRTTTVVTHGGTKSRSPSSSASRRRPSAVSATHCRCRRRPPGEENASCFELKV